MLTDLGKQYSIFSPILNDKYSDFKTHRRLKATVKLPAVLHTELPRGTKGFLSQTYGEEKQLEENYACSFHCSTYGRKCLITAYKINFKLLNLE